jgi:hypothetical protein
MSNVSETPRQSADWLAAIVSKPAALVLAALLFSGWAYVGSYFQYFGLSSVAAQVSPSLFIHYAFRPLFGLVADLEDGVLPLVGVSIGFLVPFLLIARRYGVSASIQTLVCTIVGFTFVYFLARQTAFVDARAIARGGGTRIEFVFKTALDAVPATVSRPAPVRGRATPIAPDLCAIDSGHPDISSQRSIIVSRLCRDNRDQNLRLIWRTPTHVIVAGKLPNAFRHCGDRPDKGSIPEYCDEEEDRNSLQVPNVYLIENGVIEQQVTNQMDVWTGLAPN